MDLPLASQASITTITPNVSHPTSMGAAPLPLPLSIGRMFRRKD